MPEKIFCYVPSVCIDDEDQMSVQVRKKLKIALALQLKPIGIPANTHDVAVSLDDEVVREVRRIAKINAGLTPGRVVGGLLYALHWSKRLADETLDANEVELAGVSPVTKGLRTGQKRVVEEAAPLLLNGRVVFSECGTGTGKARMIAHTAAFLLDARDQRRLPARPYAKPDGGFVEGSKVPPNIKQHLSLVREIHEQRLGLQAEGFGHAEANDFFEKTACVVVAAPTVENISHLVKEWLSVKKNLDPAGLRRVGIRLGRAQFVDPLALELQLSEVDPEVKAFSRLRKWFYAGMPAGVTTTSKAFLRLEPGLGGLMADLIELAKQDQGSGGAEIDTTACALDEEVGDDEESAEQFVAHKKNARGQDLIFTTLAAVAMDNLMLTRSTSSGLLPPNIGALIVDEAHEFEPIQASLSAHSLSLSNLSGSLGRLHDVVPKDALQKALAAVRGIKEQLSALPDQQTLPPSGSDGERVWAKVIKDLRVLAKCIEPLVKDSAGSKRRTKTKGVSPAQRNALKIAMRSLEVIRRVTGGEEWAARGIMSRSPIKGYVSMTFGPSTVTRHLASRWHVTPCAMLYSGSLYHISSAGPNARFAAASLGATDRMAQTGSFIPSWLTTLPTLYQPSAERMHTFIPPPREGATPTAMRFWLENVAAAVAKAAQDAVGGTLVLLTGYERLNVLHQVIKDIHPKLAQDRLIVQSPTAGVSYCAGEFRRKSAEGLRPIWLGTGGAWTGLDLSDDKVEPENDRLLTDLVIPAIPFGLSNNTTHFDRLRRMGFVAEIMVAQRKLRQGLGRLIRRDGVKDRRIWMLDARVLNPATAHRYADIRAVLLQYTRKERF